MEAHGAAYNSVSAGLIPGIARDDILNTQLEIPPLAEQRKIGRLLLTWTAAAENVERLLVAKRLRLNYLRERHLGKPRNSRKVKLNTATYESTTRNGKRLGRGAVMAVTKKIGMRPMREETIGAVIDRYKVVRPKAFAYNPMRLNIGSIAMSFFDEDVLVSPDYVIFECDETKLLPAYLNHLRHTRLWAGHFDAAGSGGVRIRIYYDDLGVFTFPLPSLEEQKCVLAVLNAAVVEIETLERYLVALKTQKRGLIQKLLSGQWRLKLVEAEAA
jgi:type I restriction enzyme S subunit